MLLQYGTQLSKLKMRRHNNANESVWRSRLEDAQPKRRRYYIEHSTSLPPFLLLKNFSKNNFSPEINIETMQIANMIYVRVTLIK